MIIIGMTAARRAMRHHQGLELPPQQRLPLWRLLAGELLWALQQLWEEPRVLAALLAGGVGTFAVFGDPAPGPVLPLPGRLLIALVGAHVLARAAWAWTRRGRTQPAQARPAGAKRPAVAVTELVGLVAAVTLLVWLALWIVALLR